MAINYNTPTCHFTRFTGYKLKNHFLAVPTPSKSILQGAVNQFSLNWGQCLRLFSTLPKSNFALVPMQCIRTIPEPVEQGSCHAVNWDITLYYFHLPLQTAQGDLCSQKATAVRQHQSLHRWSELNELQRSFPVDNMFKNHPGALKHGSLIKLMFIIFMFIAILKAASIRPERNTGGPQRTC